MTETVLAFIASLHWQDWITIFGFAFGIITLVAYIDQKRSAKGSAKLLRWAALNLDKNVSEQEIQQLFRQKEAMEAQISQHIPALARIAVLKEQAEIHRKAIAVHFSAWGNLKSELGSSEVMPGLDHNIQNAIVTEIIPRFQQEQEANRLRTRLTVLSVSVAAVSAALPFNLSSILGIIVSPVLLSAAIRLLAISEPSIFKSLRPFIHMAYWGLVVAVGGFGVALILNEARPAAMYLAWTLCAIAVVFVFLYPFLRVMLNKYLDKLEASARHTWVD